MPTAADQNRWFQHLHHSHHHSGMTQGNHHQDVSSHSSGNAIAGPGGPHHHHPSLNPYMNPSHQYLPTEEVDMFIHHMDGPGAATAGMTTAAAAGYYGLNSAARAAAAVHQYRAHQHNLNGTFCSLVFVLIVIIINM